MADLHQPRRLALAYVGDALTQHPQVGKRLLERRTRAGDGERQFAGASYLRVSADGRREERRTQRGCLLSNRLRHVHRNGGGVDHHRWDTIAVGQQTLRSGHHLGKVAGSRDGSDDDVAIAEVRRTIHDAGTPRGQRLGLGPGAVVDGEVAALLEQAESEHGSHAAGTDPAEPVAVRRSSGHRASPPIGVAGANVCLR